MHRLVVAALLALFSPPVPAAQIDAGVWPGSQRPWLRVGQSILPGDERLFLQRLAATPGATVVLSGPGGSVDAALAIGRLVRAQGLTTAVPAGADCASACALIWMAGQRRLLGRGARIGFHAISVMQRDGSQVQTHEFDHVLRRYLNELGFAADMTATMVNTRAAAVRWLDPIELRASGVPVEAPP